MVLAAWAQGIGSSPNGIRNPAPAAAAIPLRVEETIATLISFGYPARPVTPRLDDVEGILRRVKRRPLDELVVWLD
jgi:nitroreductase